MSIHTGGRGPGHLARVQGNRIPPSILGSSLAVWFDNQDLTTMWQDAAATVPAAIGSSVYKQFCKANPAFYREQSTSAQRPILGRHPKGGRRNLLVRAREFDNASWVKTDTTITANAANGVGGTATMDLATEGTVGLAGLLQAATIAANSTNTFAADLKRGNTDWVRVLVYETATGANQIIGWFNLATGAAGSASNGGTGSGATVTVRNLGNGIYRCILTGAVNNSATAITVQINSASANASHARVNNATRYQDRAQLEAGAIETAFQDVTSTYDCTETGVPDCYFLQADGSDDGMVTPTLDLSATDKIGAFTAVRKLSDAARAMITEFGNNTIAAFRLEGPANVGDVEYAFSSAGSSTAFAGYNNAAGAAPNTSILTGLANISDDSAVLRVNGAVAATSAANQGTGNFGNYALYFFRRGGSSLPYNGLEYGNVIATGSFSDAQIAAMEAYYNNIVGAYA